jgi:hypothetical protein
VVTWIPPEIDGGQSFAIPIQVTDAGDLSATASIAVDVQKLQRAPVFASIAQPLLVAPGGTLQATVTATDPDIYSYPVTYSLGEAPAGAAIDPQSGVLTWVAPANAANGATEQIVVQATEAGGADLSSTETVNVQVLSPQPPVFASIAQPPVVAPGATLQVSDIKAADPTAYAYPVTYSLAKGAPAGATINSQTGVLTWAVPASLVVPAGGMTVPIGVTATEVSATALSSSITLNVQVANQAASATVIAEQQGTAWSVSILPAPTVPSAAALPPPNFAAAMQAVPVALPEGIQALYGFGNTLGSASLFGNEYIPDLGHGSSTITSTAPSNLQEPKVEPSQSNSDNHAEFRLGTPDYVGDGSHPQRSDDSTSDSAESAEIVAATDAAIEALCEEESLA